MNKEIFNNLKFTYEELAEAVQYGYQYNQLSQPEEGKVIPDGNIQQWILATVKRSSDEWQKIDPSITILDPDGWDRTYEGWKRAWYEELITYQEYVKRRVLSTCKFN